ncbi:MAG: hypothetical protein ABIQ09_04015 [Jatrophihabitantaceae bacterium]
MSYARFIPLAMEYGRQFGPKALKALAAIAPLVEKNPQLRKLSDQMSSRVVARRSGSGIAAQIDIAKEFARDALTEQSIPERQDLARSWAQKAKRFEMQLRVADVGPAKQTKARRADVANQVDTLLTEIIETIAKWGDS